MLCLPTEGTDNGKGLPAFEDLSGSLRLKMEERLKKRQHDSDPCSFKSDQLHSILSRLVDNRSNFIKHAKEIDKNVALSDGSTLSQLVKARVDASIPTKMSGKNLAEKLCQSWGVIRYILRHDQFSRAELHELQTYVEIMERVETFCREQLFVASKSAKGDGRTIKLKGEQAARLYLKGGGTKPNLLQFPDCACCTHGLIDEPKENKKARRENEQISKDSSDNHKVFLGWKAGTGPPLMIDGKIMTEWKPPKMKDQLIVCHCGQNHHSNVVGGSKCILKCYDKKSRTQYPEGECPACKCDCRFVCTTV